MLVILHNYIKLIESKRTQNNPTEYIVSHHNQHPDHRTKILL